MQEEVEQKTFNIVVSTTKLTARTILNAGKAAIQQQQAKMAGGKQSVRMLLRQNRGVVFQEEKPPSGNQLGTPPCFQTRNRGVHESL